MHIKNIILFLVILSFGSCQDDRKNNPKKSSGVKISKTLKDSNITHADVAYDIRYEENSDSTQLKIKSAKIKIPGMITDHFFEDLDYDNQDEAYFITTTNSGEVHISGFVASDIYVTTIYYAGVAGAIKGSTKKFRFQNGQIIETVNVPTPDGKKIKNEVRYNLVASKGTYVLKPEGWRKEELAAMVGKYETNITKDTKIENYLYLNHSENGDWIVDIIIKNSATKSNICTFQSVGEFINKTLYVPLSRDNNEFDATLKLVFVDYTAAVYTKDLNNAIQLSQYCDGKGSLAGNYKKSKKIKNE